MKANSSRNSFVDSSRVLRLSIFILLFFLITSLTGPTAWSQIFKRYGFAEGLENEYIVNVTQDQYNNLWLATLGGGFSRFNGLQFTNYTVRKGLSHNFVMNVYCGTNSIYATSDLGISIMDESEKIISYGNDPVTSSVLRDEVFYFRDYNGFLNRLQGNSITKIELGEKVRSLQLLNNSVLVLSESNSLYEVDHANQVTRIFDFNKAPVFESGDYRLLIGKGPDYLKKVLVVVPINFPLSIITSKSEMYQVVGDDFSRFWVVMNQKLYSVGTNGSIEMYSTSNSFTDARVNCLFKDVEGNIWCGTNDGLYRIQASHFRTIGIVKGDNLNGPVIARWNNSVVLGTQSGELLQYAGNEKLNRFKSGWESVISVLPDQLTSDLWVGTVGEGLYRLSKNGVAVHIDDSQIAQARIRALYQSENGQLWIGTAKGLFVLENDRVIKAYRIADGLADDVIWSIKETPDGSIVILTRSGLNYIKEGKVLLESRLSSIKKMRVTCLLIKDGNFWIGTLGFGLVYFNPKTGESQIYTTDQGLYSDVIINLSVVGNDILIGSFKGIDRISLPGKHIYHLGNELTPTNYNSFFYDSITNHLYFGNRDKVMSYEVVQNKPKAPRIRLQSVRLVKLSNEEIELPKSNALLSHTDNSLRFEFFGVSLSNPEAVNYSFRLIGLDTSWSLPSKARHVTFSNLAPGNYRLEVISFNHEGVRSLTKADYAFQIQRPIWQEIWFLVIITICIVVLLWQASRYRLRRKLQLALRAEQEKQEILAGVRKNIARDFHDNMGNKLAGIKLYSNLVGLKLKGQHLEAAELITYIEKNAHELFEGTKDFIWSIDPESDNLVEVYTYLKDFGEEFFKRSNFSFFSSMKSESESIKIPPGWSRQIVLIFKEAMTNTMKHSNGSIARFELWQSETSFTFTFSDNGTSQNSGTHGKGMTNMRSRAEALGCQFEVLVTEQEFKIVVSGNVIIASSPYK